MDTNIFRSIATVDKSWLSLQSAKIQFFSEITSPMVRGASVAYLAWEKARKLKFLICLNL
jgi:hypothetical protein